MKKRVIIFVVFAIIALIATNVLASSYMGNSNTGKFHYSSCRWAHKIAPHNRVPLNSREEAIEMGFVPCKVCRP